jgi:hypothetical protein
MGVTFKRFRFKEKELNDVALIAQHKACVVSHGRETDSSDLFSKIDRYDENEFKRLSCGMGNLQSRLRIDQSNWNKDQTFPHFRLGIFDDPFFEEH